MKGVQVVLGQVGQTDVAAKIENGILQDLIVEQGDIVRVGTILRGKVDRPLKGQGGVIIKTALGNGFLRKAKSLSEGQVVTVQVSGLAEDGKAFPVTTRVIFKSRFAIVTPFAPGLNISRQIRDDDLRDQLDLLAKEGMDGSDFGLIIRSAANAADAEDVAEDIAAMRSVAEQLMADTGTDLDVQLDGDGPSDWAWREWPDADDVQSGPAALEDCGVLDVLDSLESAKVPLGSGHLFVEPTRALAAIDVNTGGDTSPSAGLKTNLAACPEILRQLRLRGIGGQITIDFAPLAKKDRRAVETALRKACRNCSVDTEFIGWTPLGHAELKRKRERVFLDVTQL